MPNCEPPWLKKCISCIPRSLLHVYNTETWQNVLNRPGSEPASRGTHTHTHTHTHTYRSTIQYLTFLMTTYTWSAFQNVSYVLAVALMCKLNSFSNYSTFLSAKYCWFLLTSIHLFKNTLQTLDIFWKISLNALGEISSGSTVQLISV